MQRECRRNLALAGTQSPVGGLFAPRSPSGPTFTNPASSAISIVNNTAVDLFHNIADFAGNAAVAVHNDFGSPAHDAASGAVGSAAQSAPQSTAADSGTKSFAATGTSAGKSANRAAANKAQGAPSDTTAARSGASGSAGSKAKKRQASASAGMYKDAVIPAAEPSASPVVGNVVQGAHGETTAARGAAAGSTGNMAKKKQPPVAAGTHNDEAVPTAEPSASRVAGSMVQGAPQDASAAPAAAASSTRSMAVNRQPPVEAGMQSAEGSSAAETGHSASRVADNKVQGAAQEASTAPAAAASSTGSMDGNNNRAPVASGMQDAEGSLAAATGQSASGVANSKVQGAHPIGTAAGASGDGSAGSIVDNSQVPLAASMHGSMGSIAPAAGLSPSGVADRIVQGASQGATAAGVSNSVVQGAYQGGSAAGPSAYGSAGSMVYNDRPTAVRHNGIGSVVEAADQSVMNLAAKAKGHVMAVEQFANTTKSTIKGLLPASKAEVQTQLQQQGNQAQAGEDDLQRELKQQDAALKAQLKQQDAKLSRQERWTRKQAGKIYQQNVTITDLITQVNMNTTNYDGPHVTNGTGGSTGAPALGACSGMYVGQHWLHKLSAHGQCQGVQCDPHETLALRLSYFSSCIAHPQSSSAGPSADVSIAALVI